MSFCRILTRSCLFDRLPQDVLQQFEIPQNSTVLSCTRKRAAAYGNDSHVFFSSFVDGLPPSFVVPFLLATRFASSPTSVSYRAGASSTIPESRGRATDADGLRKELDLSRMHRRHRRRWCGNTKSKLHLDDSLFLGRSGAKSGITAWKSGLHASSFSRCEINKIQNNQRWKRRCESPRICCSCSTHPPQPRQSGR